MRECVIPDCDKTVPRDKLMCRVHWFMVPKKIRDDLASAERTGSKENYDLAVASAQKVVMNRMADEWKML